LLLLGPTFFCRLETSTLSGLVAAEGTAFGFGFRPSASSQKYPNRLQGKLQKKGYARHGTVTFKTSCTKSEYIFNFLLVRLNGKGAK